MNPSYNLQKNLEKAVIAYRSGNLENTTDLCKEILSRYPEHAEAFHLLGVVTHQAGNYNEAAQLIQQAIKYNPTAAQYYYNLGNSWYSQRKYQKAGTAYDKAIKLQPINPKAWNRLGLCRQRQYEFTAARRAYLKALQQQPNYTTALNNLGLLCFAEKDYRNASNLFRKTLKLDPQHIKACHNLATSLQNLGAVDEAIIYYKKTLELNPELPGARRQLIKLLQSTCSWSSLAQALSDIDKITTSSLQKHQPPEESPFLHLTHSLDSNRNLSIAQSWSTALSELVDPTKKLSPNLSTDNIIKIGYLSCDYQDHPVAHNMLNLFRLHDRNQFHISAYSCGSDDGSDYRKRISQDCDVFVDLQKMSNHACAQRIQADGIHILVELMGHTSKERLGICAFKPAPIQVSYLAYPGTTGAQFIDYLITDEIVIPPNRQSYYSEKIIYLPDCFMVADRAPIGPRPQRLSCGLPENGFIFCSFNTAFKIEPIMFKVWMDILR
ncbi:MAG: tetratricopeptide repeat protein, partial [Deltaproteobacteria bacterium]|nr:tetratricopeptide repeat protein [Candidatus Tharpella aukensis]